MKLIVGLGNPGKEYENTRHNVGFIFIEYLCRQLNIFLDNYKFGGIFTKTKINNEDVIIAKPLTFMNLSGEFVSNILSFFKIKTDDILVVYDDLDLKQGLYKIKLKGSSGGQNGIKNIISHLKTENIKRIKIGIGRPNDPKISIPDYVLGKLTYSEQCLILNNFPKLKEVVEYFVEDKFLQAINKFN